MPKSAGQKVPRFTILPQSFPATPDAAKDAAKFKVVHLGSKYDLAEGDEGYRLLLREEWFDDAG